jgi:hypothetical protein
LQKIDRKEKARKAHPLKAGKKLCSAFSQARKTERRRKRKRKSAGESAQKKKCRKNFALHFHKSGKQGAGESA